MLVWNASTGQLVGTNRVLYPNAFDGVSADVLYTYKRGGFEQDVILKRQPPTPESFGLDPATVREQFAFYYERFDVPIEE